MVVGPVPVPVRTVPWGAVPLVAEPAVALPVAVDPGVAVPLALGPVPAPALTVPQEEVSLAAVRVVAVPQVRRSRPAVVLWPEAALLLASAAVPAALEPRGGPGTVGRA